MSPDDKPVPRHLWRVVRRRRSVVLTAIVACVLGAYLLSSAQTSVYESSAEVLVQPRNTGSIFTATAPLAPEAAERLIATEAEFIESTLIRGTVQADLQLREPPPPVDAEPIEGTDVIRLTVRNSDPASAAAVVAAYTEAFIELRRTQAVDELESAVLSLTTQVNEIERSISQAPTAAEREALQSQRAALSQAIAQLRLDAGLRTGGASVIESPDIPSSPVAPQPVRAAIIALLVGLLIGLGAALLLDTLDNVVFSAEDVARITRLPVLAALPEEPPLDSRPMALSQPMAHTVDLVRTLGTDLQLLAIDREIAVIQITSAVGGEGASTVAANLAVVMARTGRRVALVDANLRQPRLHEMFGHPASPGLTETVLGAPIAGAMHPVGTAEALPLDLLVAGGRPPHPGELLASQRLKDILAGLRSSYEVVIIDSTAIDPVSDSLALAPLVDTVVVVTRSGRTTRPQVATALERLRSVRAPVDGIVLTHVADGTEPDEQPEPTDAPTGASDDTPPAPVVTFDFGDKPPLGQRILMRLGVGRR